jgi:HEAT repeat protein
VADDAPPTETAHRRRAAVLAGHRRDEVGARALRRDADPAVRAAAVGALSRMGRLLAGDLAEALEDPDPGVRRRACEAVATTGLDVEAAVRVALGDADPAVVEAAAWALGELGGRGEPGADGSRSAETVTELVRVATEHADALSREAAVAALGAIGDPRGLPAVLAATSDRPAIRRRAVIALAAFEGPAVDEALARARLDRDWQVRQAAEDLLDQAPDNPATGG